MRRFNLYVIALLIAGSVAIVLPALAEEQGSSAQSGEVQERAVPALPPYHCGSGVCLCVGQANCAQLIEPTPCKRQKFCVGQTVSPPPLPPQEPALSKKSPPSTARTTTLNLLICSCRSGQ
jgi:hypothetical protein